MRIISTKTHGVLDYLTGAALLAAPKALGLEDVPSSACALQLAGGATAYSLLMDYELGAAKLLPMPVHLALDAASGALLASSPWLFGFVRHGMRYWLPHVLVGAQEILAAAISRNNQDALIKTFTAVSAPEADEDGETQPIGGRSR